jgi:hypothetical protein
MSDRAKKILGISAGAILGGFLLLFLALRKDISLAFHELSPSQQELYRQVEEKLPNVKLGMTREQVRTIVGEPESVSKFDYRGRKLETWYFPQELATVSDRTYCTFDADTGRVIRVTVRGRVERIDEAFRSLRYGPRTGDGGAEAEKPVGAE